MKKSTNKNQALAIVLVAIVIGLLAGSFASAPLYRIFCQITGFGGQPSQATQPGAVSTLNTPAVTPEAIKNFHPLTFLFDKTIDQNTPIKVTILTPRVDAKINETKKVVYQVENLSNETFVLTSSYNATPQKYAHDIVKTQCFCFEKHTLKPYERKNFAVVFFISPTIISTEGAEKLRELTIGYHFYRAS